MADVEDADPVAVVVAYLNGHPDAQAVLGGAGRVSSRNEPPYPHCKITDPPGDDRDLRWLTAPLVQLETHGDLDGTPGKAQLRRIHYTLLRVLRDLPDTPQTGPVVTAVTYPTGGGWLPEPTSQPRYLSRVRLYLHP